MSQEKHGVQEYVIRPTGRQDIRFMGQLIASVTGAVSILNKSFMDQILHVHDELYLYRTAGGSYVCHIAKQWEKDFINKNAWTEHKAAVCSRDEEVREFFGYSESAKQLYADAGIDAALAVS